MLLYSSHFNVRVLCPASPEQVNKQIKLMTKWTRVLFSRRPRRCQSRTTADQTPGVTGGR